MATIVEIASRRTGTEVQTPAFRAAFANLLKAKQINNSGDPKYSVLACFAKDADLKDLKAAFQEAAKKKWGSDAKKIVDNPNFVSPFLDQGERLHSVTGELYAGMEAGATCISFKSTESHPPGIVDVENKGLLTSDEVYSGMIARATVEAFAWDNHGKKGISFGLGNVQKIDDGPRLGGGKRPANTDFDPLPESLKTGTDDTSANWD